MQIVTVANRRPTESYMCFDEMLASCRRFGHEPLLIGWGEKFGGLGSKPRLLLQAIEDGKIKDGHTLFIDAFDAVLARPPCDIMAVYYEYKAPIVWGAERNLFPAIPCDRDKVFPDAPGGFRYLNSGVCVAETEALREYLLHIKAPEIRDDHYNPDGSVNHINDQEIALLAYAEEPQCLPMKLDTKCGIALNTFQVSAGELDMGGERIRIIETGAEPCVFHMNGPAKSSPLTPMILKKLRLR